MMYTSEFSYPKMTGKKLVIPLRTSFNHYIMEMVMKTSKEWRENYEFIKIRRMEKMQNKDYEPPDDNYNFPSLIMNK